MISYKNKFTDDQREEILYAIDCIKNEDTVGMTCALTNEGWIYEDCLESHHEVDILVDIERQGNKWIVKQV